MKDLISVVLTSYNGQKYIKDQIDSIIRQTWENWELIIVDNNSKDDTLKIVREAHPKLLGKKIFIHKNTRNLGLARSFQNGLKHTRGKYIAVCNQDDVWLPNKLRIQYEVIKKNGCGLVYTDMTVVDNTLNIIAVSYQRRYLSFLVNSKNDSFEELLHENHVGAPTIMFTASLKENLYPFSRFGYEDNWIALHAAMATTIKYVDKSTMLYRQHETNLQGAGRFTFFSLLRRDRTFLEKHITKKQKYVAFLKDLLSSRRLSYYHQFLISQKIYNHELLIGVLRVMSTISFSDICRLVLKLLKINGTREAEQVVYFYLLTRVYKVREQ